MTKDYFKDFIARKKSELENLLKRADESDNIDEVKALKDHILAIKEELAKAEAELAELEQDKAENSPAGTESNGERAFHPMASYRMTGNAEPDKDPAEVRGTMEYRKAFKQYYMSGVKSEILETQKRSDDPSTTSDMGVLLPKTIIDEVIKGLDGVYGQLYEGVRKTNILGGVEYPVGAFSATFSWVAETDDKPDDQDGGGITGSVTFGYKTGRARIARTLVAENMSVEVFEKELADGIVKSYVKEMDKQILSGTGLKDMTGILTEATAVSSRIQSSHIIEMTQSDVNDWTQWQKKVFKKLPLAMRGKRVKFVCTVGTWEGEIKTLADDNKNPVVYENFNQVTGEDVLRFRGKDVTLIETDLGIKDFDTAEAGEYFGMFWVPEQAYAINTNLEFSIERYYDRDKLQWIRQAVVIIDGKPLDTDCIYLLKKKAG